MIDDETHRWRTDNAVARWLAWRLLHFAEWILPLTYGWVRTDARSDGEFAWDAPPAHPKAPDLYGRSHAINSTKHYFVGTPPRSRSRVRGRRQ